MLPEADAIRNILPKYHRLTKKPPDSKESVRPHVPITEPDGADTPDQHKIAHQDIFLRSVLSEKRLSISPKVGITKPR